MATSRKPTGSSSRSTSKRSTAAKSAGGTAAREGGSSTRRSAKAGSRARRPPSSSAAHGSEGGSTTAETASAQPSDGRARIAKGALGALAGTVALGLAGRAAIKRTRRPHVLGVRVPRQLAPRQFELKKVVQQIGDIAERVEHASEDVRLASAQAKRVSEKLS